MLTRGSYGSVAMAGVVAVMVGVCYMNERGRCRNLQGSEVCQGNWLFKYEEVQRNQLDKPERKDSLEVESGKNENWPVSIFLVLLLRS